MGRADDATRATMVAAALAARDGMSRSGEAGSEELLTMRELARRLRRSPSWLHRMGVPDRAGIRLAGGRPLYRIGEVMEYLSGPEAIRQRDALRRTGWGRRSNVADASRPVRKGGRHG